jgi:P4 family phage/plasmid primase-like protien
MMSTTVIDNFLETTLGLFLDGHRVTEKGETCSMTGMGIMRGKFMIKDNEYPHFLDLLYEYLFTQQRRPLNIVEQRRCDFLAPILIDLDFKYPHERAIERQFQLNNIYEFIRGYVGNITHFYDFTANTKPLRFFITLRPGPYEDKKSMNRAIKDGVHIQCPDLILSSEHQQVLRHRSLERGQLSTAFKNTGFINTEKDIFDEAIVKKNGWFFYGESKPDIPAYHLAAVYVYSPTTETFHEENVEDYSSRQLIEILSIRYNLQVQSIKLQNDHEEEWRARMEYCIGKRAAPNGTCHTANTITGPGEEEKGDGNTVVIQLTSNNVHEQLEKDKIETIKKLVLECLSPGRAGPYKEWIELGWCLHHIDPSEEMFELWMEFSRKSPKFGEHEVAGHRKEWIKMAKMHHEHPLTERALHYWAKEDNYKRYRQLMNDSFVSFVERDVDVTHTHVARLMKLMYKNEYCAAVDAKKVEWFQFTGVFWKKLAQGIELRNKMSTEVAQVISDARAKIRGQLMNNGGDERETSWEQGRIKKLFDVEKNLYQSGFKDSVMKDCIGIFYEEDFNLKLNSNQYLMGFSNGVIDLHANVVGLDGKKEFTVIFRKAEPSDFITFMAGRYNTKNCEPIEYIEYDPMDPDEEHSRINGEIDDFMEKVFPRPELRAYMWRKLASCLEGANKEQTYETWIGVGGNGKSKLVDLMSMALGDYASSLQSTAMTRKRPDSGAANPDIMAIRNKRFIYMAEPDDREPLNTSRMKQFTGEDDVEARGLFEDQTKFKITGKIFMLCNAFPAINTMDRGTWRRVRAVPFESKFVDPGVEDVNPKEHVYPRDGQLDAKMKEWRTLFMSRLVYIYKTEYLPHGLGKVPAIVTQESMKYQESFDSLAKFTNARIREVKTGGHEATIQEIFRSYKGWYESIGGGVGRKLTQTDLYKRLSDKCGEPSDKKTFKQMMVFQNDEDMEEYDKMVR